MEKVVSKSISEKEKTVLDFLIKTKDIDSFLISECKNKIKFRINYDFFSGKDLSWYDYLENYVSEANINPEQTNMVRACWELMNGLY